LGEQQPNARGSHLVAVRQREDVKKESQEKMKIHWEKEMERRTKELL